MKIEVTPCKYYSDEFSFTINGKMPTFKQKEELKPLFESAPEMLEMLVKFIEITNTFSHPRIDHLRGSAKKLIKQATEIK